MSDETKYGYTDFIAFRSLKERLIFIAVWRIALALNSSYKSQAANWVVVLYRVITWRGTEDEMLSANKEWFRRVVNTYTDDIWD